MEQQGIIYGNCRWCKSKRVPLTSHHHPILKSKKGKKTIRICLNCHYKFHHPPMRIIDLRGFPILSRIVDTNKISDKDYSDLQYKTKRKKLEKKYERILHRNNK